MTNFIIVFAGAGLGGALRYYMSNLIHKYVPPYFPYGTLTVNFLGSLILGFLIFAFDEKELVSSNVKLFIGIGFCGGFTTFSTFSFETFKLLNQGEIYLATANILGNVLLTIAGIYLAYIIGRLI